jgi:membrane-bound metal-dependent hydrolase YbcI (DUF457 family)
MSGEQQKASRNQSATTTSYANLQSFKYSEVFFMPLPLGHALIGLTTHELCSENCSAFSRVKLAVFIVILANLPDIDVLIGLLLQGNGNAFHRGPTHSLMFALFMGFLASHAWRLWPKVPKVTFNNCFLFILSHNITDLFFTNAPVSLFWPFEVNWTIGHSGWGDVMGSVFLQVFQDAEIALGCGVIITFHRLITLHSYKIKHFIKSLKIHTHQVVPLPK